MKYLRLEGHEPWRATSDGPFFAHWTPRQDAIKGVLLRVDFDNHVPPARLHDPITDVIMEAIDCLDVHP